MKKKLVILIAFLLAFFCLLIYLYSSQQTKLKKKQELERSQAEQNQLFSAAQNYIRKNSVVGFKFDLKVLKKLDKWALLEVIPINPPTDEAAIILEKVDSQWVARAFGTIFPEWEEKVPELFKENEYSNSSN